MANSCIICERRWPPEPVRVLLIEGSFLEFCDECKDDNTVLMRPDGSPVSLLVAWQEAKADVE
jgi:ribosome-binding protein aMBF1 (putative translation factor)